MLLTARPNADKTFPTVSIGLARLGVAMSLILASGCMLLNPPEIAVPEEPDIVDQLPAMTPEDREILILLDEATFALSQDRLTTPVVDNAYTRYLRILSIDPDNLQALTGLSDIVEKYLDWAVIAAERGASRSANNYLAKARAVDELHPNILAIERQINEKLAMSDMTYQLSVEGLSERALWVRQELLDIGSEAKRKGAAVLITARNDGEARWIYQQLNDAQGDRRIRGEIEIGSIPSVKLLFVPGTPSEN